MAESEVMFGNVSQMTRSDFDTAITYFQKRLEQIKKDKKIDGKTSTYFENKFGKRIEELTNLRTRLAERIARKRADGDFVNEAAETLGSKANKKPFRKLYSEGRYRTAQAFKILGAICLPIVGTIPLIKSLIRARKQQKILKRENVELSDFVAKNARSYDLNLISNEPLTDAEIIVILGRGKSEIDRLEKMIKDPSNYHLNPFQVKNLTEKLKKIREFAQNNGYENVVDVSGNKVYELPDEALATTKTDELNKEIIKLYNDSETYRMSVVSGNFSDIYFEFAKLQQFKIKAEELKNKLPKDADKTLIDMIIEEIDKTSEDCKTAATSEITDKKAIIESAITAATTTSDTRADLENSNTDLENAVGTGAAATASLGETLAEAVAHAEEMGISAEELTALQTSYHTAHESNDKKLEEIKVKTEGEETVENATTRLGEIVGNLNPSSGEQTAITEDHLKDSIIKPKIDRLIAEAEGLIESAKSIEVDAATRTTFESAQRGFMTRKSEYDAALKGIEDSKKAAEKTEQDNNLMEQLEEKLKLIELRLSLYPDASEINESNAEIYKDPIKTLLDQVYDKDLELEIMDYVHEHPLPPPTLSSKLVEIRNKVNVLSKKIEDVIKDMKKKEKDEEKKEEEKSALQTEVNKVKEKIENLQRDIENAFSKFGMMKEVISGRKTETVSDDPNTKSGYKNKLSDFRGKVESIKREISELKRKGVDSAIGTYLENLIEVVETIISEKESNVNAMS